MNAGKILIAAGIILIIAGIALLLHAKLPVPGRLPGDIVIKKGGFTLYLPLTTSLVVSAIITLIAWILKK